MKLMVNFAAPLTDIDGKAIVEVSGVASVRAALVAAGISGMLLDQATAALRPFWGTGGEPEQVTLTACRACANALQSPDQGLSGADRVDRMRLAIRLMDPKQPVEVSEKEKDIILKAVEKAYPGALVYFRIHELFEQAAMAKALPEAAAA